MPPPDDLFKGFSYVRSPTHVTAGLNVHSSKSLPDSVGSAGSETALGRSVSPP